jgi:hypothetical protein
MRLFLANENKLSDEDIKKMIDNGSPQIFIADVSENSSRLIINRKFFAGKIDLIRLFKNL